MPLGRRWRRARRRRRRAARLDQRFRLRVRRGPRTPHLLLARPKQLTREVRREEREERAWGCVGGAWAHGRRAGG
eukprot:903989-Prymnesium_polylepis.1